MVGCTWSAFTTDMCLSQIDNCQWGVAFEMFLFVYALVGLAASSDHLCNSMETLCDHWRIREDVAGATFLALGGSIPEITVNAIATFQTESDSSDLGVGAILGSGMIAFLLIPSLCSLLSPRHLSLKRTPFIRDVVFYSAALVVLLHSVYSGVTVMRALALLAVYAAYVLVLVFGPRLYRWWVQDTSDEAVTSEVSVFRERYDSERSFESPATTGRVQEKRRTSEDMQLLAPLLNNDKQQSSRSVVLSPGVEASAIHLPLMINHAEEHLVHHDPYYKHHNCGTINHQSSSLAVRVYEVCSYLFSPIKGVVDRVCPDCRIYSPFENYYPLTFVVSFACISFFSFVITVIADRWVALLQAPGAMGFFGVSIVALGAEIPDAVNAVTVSMRGYGPMATSACIGAQVVNICVGLGLPWLIKIAVLGLPVLITNPQQSSLAHPVVDDRAVHFIELLAWLQIAFVLALTCVVMAPSPAMRPLVEQSPMSRRYSKHKGRLSKGNAKILMGVYVATLLFLALFTLETASPLSTAVPPANSGGSSLNSTSTDTSFMGSRR